MLSIKDVVDLAKAGYKPADVKELMELSKTSDATVSEAQPPQADQTVSQSQPDVTQADNDASAAPKESDQTATEPDYKALYEAEKEKVNSLQKINTNADVSGPSETDILSSLSDVIRDYC